MTLHYQGIFLDDERLPEHVSWIRYPAIEWFAICRNPADFIEVAYDSLNDIQSDEPLLISFDHDLGMNGSGKECLNALCDLLLDHPTFVTPKLYFHSQNPVGCENMRQYWQNFLYSQNVKENTIEKINQKAT